MVFGKGVITLMGKTHLIGGGMAAMSVITLKGTTEPLEMAVIFAGGFIGSLAPDLDHKKSKLSNANIITKLVSTVVCMFTTHRNATHTLLACGVIGVIGYLLALVGTPLINILIGAVGFTPLSVTEYALLFGISMLLGALSHLIFDFFNDAGVPFFKPFSQKRFRIMNITTSSMGEAIFAAVASVILLTWMVLAVINMEQFAFLKMFKIW